jgi:hypothetical protein
MSLAASYLVLAVGIVLTAIALKVTIRLIRADGIESRKSAARVRSLKDAVLGRAIIRDDFLPDARVQAGMVYNETEKRLEVSGRLSVDSLERVYR